MATVESACSDAENYARQRERDISVYIYLEFLNGGPAAGRKLLQHGHEPLETAVPVRQQQDHRHQVADAQKFAGDREKLQQKQRSAFYTAGAE